MTTWLLVFLPTTPKELGKVMTENQHRASLIGGWKSCLDPFAHGVFMNAEQAGNLFHHVRAVNFYEAMIRMASPHDGDCPLVNHVASRFQFRHQVADL